MFCLRLARVNGPDKIDRTRQAVDPLLTPLSFPPLLLEFRKLV